MILVSKKSSMTFSQVFCNIIYVFILASKRSPNLNINQLRRLVITLLLTDLPTLHKTRPRPIWSVCKLSDVVLTSPLWAHTDQWCFLVSLQALCSPDRVSCFSATLLLNLGLDIRHAGCSGNDLWSPSFSSSSRARWRVSSCRENARSFVMLAYKPLGLQNSEFADEGRIVQVSRIYFSSLECNIAQPQHKCLSWGFNWNTRSPGAGAAGALNLIAGDK